MMMKYHYHMAAIRYSDSLAQLAVVWKCITATVPRTHSEMAQLLAAKDARKKELSLV